MKEKKTNEVFSAWEVETILDGFTREIVKRAESVIVNSFDLIDFLGQLHGVRTTSFHVYYDDERTRKTPDRNDVEIENNPAPLAWDDIYDDELASAIDALLTEAQQTSRAARLAILAAYGITPETVHETALRTRAFPVK